jgi:hypothetical protein
MIRREICNRELHNMVKLLKRALFSSSHLIALMVLIHSQPAQALIKLEYSCDALGGEGTCLQNGGLTSIYIFDEITDDDANKMASIDNMMFIDQAFPKVYINSHGGLLSAGQKIGRILRRRKASIEGKDFYFPSRPALCSSSCVFIAAGAVDRQFDHIGVHLPHYTKVNQSCKTEQSPIPEHVAQLDMNYFKEMGFSEKFIEYSLNTSFDQLTEFFYDPQTPDDEQLIVQFGFHMHKNSSDRPSMFSKDGEIRNSNSIIVLENAVKEGNVKAAIQLSKIYSILTQTEAKYSNDAIKWHAKAGEMGDAISYHNLGVMLSNGIGTKKDIVSANKFYMKAALMGYAGSQNNLGWSYYKGTGIKKNLSLAIYWLTRSADQGEPFAYGSIGQMTYYGHGFPFDKIEAVKWLTLADEQMPEGETRNENHALLQKLKNTMNEDDVVSGTNLARSWLPLKQSKSLMGEKCKP